MLTDVVLPDGNGLDLVEHIHESDSELPAILCSGYTGPKSMWAEIQKRGYFFLHKPFNLQELLGAVKQVLEGSE